MRRCEICSRVPRKRDPQGAHFQHRGGTHIYPIATGAVGHPLRRGPDDRSNAAGCFQASGPIDVERPLLVADILLHGLLSKMQESRAARYQKPDGAEFAPAFGGGGFLVVMPRAPIDRRSMAGARLSSVRRPRRRL